jgi:Sulfotransferase family
VSAGGAPAEPGDRPAPRRGTPLLVTGIPRAATSWVGKMIEASGAYVYVNEPLNPDHPPGHSPGVLNVDVPHEFLYVCRDNEARYLRAFRDTVALRYHPIAELARNHTAYDALRAAKYGSAFTLGRLRGRRAMLNDPFAPLSSEWLVRRLGFQGVAIVRNAPAIVASYRRQGKSFDFRNLLAQPELMRDWLEPFREDIESTIDDVDDAVARVSLLWRVVYHVVAELRDRGLPRFSVVRHEDISLDPVEGFERIYASLGLPFTHRARRTVEWGSLSPSGTQNAERPHVWTIRGGLSKTAFRPLDSRQNLRTWRAHLSEEEAARVRSLTEDVAARFYRGDEEWW